MHRSLLVEPLVKTGAVVDVFVISPNSSAHLWQAIDVEYRSLATGDFASATTSNDVEGSEARYSDDIIAGLGLALKSCAARKALDISPSKTVKCWDVVLVWQLSNMIALNST